MKTALKYIIACVLGLLAAWLYDMIVGFTAENAVRGAIAISVAFAAERVIEKLIRKGK